MPVVARTFAELGYRRARTADIAERCGVQETILYRLWPDKPAMFVAALDHVYDLSQRTWSELLEEEGDGASAAERILDYEATHHGEFGLYRIVFAGLSETDDPEVLAGMRRLYGRFQRFIRERVREHREALAEPPGTDVALVAWAILGLGTVASIGRELDLLGPRARKRLVGEIGRHLLG